MMLPEQAAEMEILTLMTRDTYKFALEVGYPHTLEQVDALERLMLRDWIRLIDVSIIANCPGLFRVFRVMPEAVEWFKRNQQ